MSGERCHDEAEAALRWAAAECHREARWLYEKGDPVSGSRTASKLEEIIHGMIARLPEGGGRGVGFGCHDCGLPYGEPGWCDTWIPSETWNRISPTGDGAGFLCISCMARRLVAAGIDNVPLMIGSGPWGAVVRPARSGGGEQSWYFCGICESDDHDTADHEGNDNAVNTATR